MIFQFASPWWLLLLLILPVQVSWYFRGASVQRGALRFPSAGMLKRVPRSTWVMLRHSVLLLQILGQVLLIFALARPQSGRIEKRVTSEGVDIVLAVDVSGSMRAYDLGSERLDIAKETIGEFISGRVSDRLGMVVFAGESFTQCPLTIDYGILRKLLKNVTINMDGNIPDGTAIGMAIANATNRLRRTDAKSKVVILLTDGANNAGIVDPVTAARAAARVGVKIYTIGVGVDGRAPIRVRDPLFGDRVTFIDNSLNESILREVAQITAGTFYRAKSRSALDNIYDEINAMERSKIETLRIPRYSELTFQIYLIPLGLLLLLLQFILGQTLFRTLP